MSRPAKPPRLYLRQRRDGAATWVIRDAGQFISTGANAADSRAAQEAFADYLAAKHRPGFGDGDPARIAIADVLGAYAEHHAPTTRRADAIGIAVLKLVEFFGARTVAMISETTCRQYAAWRIGQADARGKAGGGRKVGPASARRELAVLSAALRFCHRGKQLDRLVPVKLPPIPPARERHLTRDEAAKLLGAALGFYRDGGTWRRHRERINRHLARFILVGIYTGTRHDAILRLQWIANTTGGHVDLASKILHRRPAGAIERNKRRPPLPLPPRLLPHLRRWRTQTARFLIEWRGRPIAHQRTAWRRARELAGLSADVTPHVLRHTCATWLLQAGVSVYDVAGVLGCSEAVVRDTYGHHAQDHMRLAVAAFSRPR